MNIDSNTNKTTDPSKSPREWVRDATHKQMVEGVEDYIEKNRNAPTYESEPDLIGEWYSYTGTQRNHDSVANILYELYNDQLCFSWELNRWLFYNGKAWETDSGSRIITTITDLINNILKVVEADQPAYLDKEGSERRDKFLAWAVGLGNYRNIESVISIARAKFTVSLADFDTNEWLLNVDNGTLDLRTGTLQPHEPRDRITLLAPVKYNPDAKYERWDSFLHETLDREEYVKYLQKELGYCLTGCSTEELLIMLYGLPASGKSTFYEPVMTALGSYGHYMSFTTLRSSNKDSGTPREDVLRLRTARLVMCSEINKNTTFDTALVKQVCSGEPIVARGLYAKDSVEFRPQFKVMIGTNYAPLIPYDDGGSYRRIKVNSFKNVVDEANVDKGIKVDFMSNPAAQERILAWLIEGCRLWQDEGIEDEPREVKQANAEYRRSQNPLGPFLEDYCVLDPSAGKGTDGTRVSDFIAALEPVRYRYNLEDLTDGSFGKFMRALGFESYRTKRERGYIGIRLKTAKEDADGYVFDSLQEEQRVTDDSYDTNCHPNCHRGEAIKSEKEDQGESRVTDDSYNPINENPIGRFENVKVYRNDLNIRHPSPNCQDQATLAAAAYQIVENFKHERRFNHDNKPERSTFLSAVASQLDLKFEGETPESHYSFVTKLSETESKFQALIADCTRGT